MALGEYMTWLARSLVCALLLYATQSSVYNAAFHVHSKKGVDDPVCLKQDLTVSKPCKSLKFVADSLGTGSENVTIFVEYIKKLNSLIVFRKSRNLSIQGRDGTLNCNCRRKSPNNKGLIIDNVQNVALSNIRIHNCCSRYKNWSAALRLCKCDGVTLTNIEITQSRFNTGLLMLNNFGLIRIRRSKVTFNGNRKES